MGVTTYDIINARVGPGPAVVGRMVAAQTLVLTTTGASTDFVLNPPVGAILQSMIVINPTAATGAPTNANLSVGKTLGGAEYVAAVDLKAAGKTVLTFATTNLADILSAPSSGAANSPAGNPSPVNIRIAFVGGTAPAMAPTFILEYTMPWADPGDGHRL